MNELSQEDLLLDSLRKAFAAVDVHQNGYILPEELEDVISHLGINALPGFEADPTSVPRSV